MGTIPSPKHAARRAVSVETARRHDRFETPEPASRGTGDKKDRRTVVAIEVSVNALVVAGARPNFVKVAPLLEALRAAGHCGVLVHTGQHYDATMSDSFFRDLGLPAPDYELGVASGTHAQQT